MGFSRAKEHDAPPRAQGGASEREQRQRSGRTDSQEMPNAFRPHPSPGGKFRICCHFAALTTSGERIPIAGRHKRHFSEYNTINIPRRSREFFLDGRSPLVLAARVTSRWYDLPIAKVCYLPPVNGLRNFPSSVVLLPDPLPADA